MKTESLQDQTPTTTGGRLRQARENMGLSQQAVAERLCLKASTVRDIEEDLVNPNLASTFLRGYIRSYARLVHISEEDLTPIKSLKVPPMQSFSLEKTHKKCDAWLMGLTWFILFVVIGLTGAWWWQNHQVQQQDITNMVNESSSKLSSLEDTPSVLLSDSIDDFDQHRAGRSTDAVADVPTVETFSSSVNTEATSNIVGKNVGNISSEVLNPSVLQSAPASMAPEVMETGVVDIDGNALVMHFSSNCWLEVFDASGKKLFSGIQHGGAKLNLIGQAPYKLKIGAPAAVQVQYHGKPVDLSRFIRSNQIARLTVAAE